MKQAVSLTIDIDVIKKVDEFSQKLERSRSETVEQLLKFIFALGVTVENKALKIYAEKFKEAIGTTFTLEDRLKALESLVHELKEKVEKE